MSYWKRKLEEVWPKNVFKILAHALRGQCPFKKYKTLTMYKVIETQVQVWQNEKLKWEHRPETRVFLLQFRILPINQVNLIGPIYGLDAC